MTLGQGERDAERIMRYFQKRDPTSSGLISREDLCGTLRSLGMSGESVEHLLRMTSFVNASGYVVYSAFVDWLVGKVPQEAYAKSKRSSLERRLRGGEALPRAALLSLYRVKRLLCEGRPPGTVHLPGELERFLSAVRAPAEVQDRMRAAWAAASAGDAVAPHGDLEGLAAADEELWEQFAQRALERLLLEVFRVVDLDQDGKLSAQELMTLLMLVTVQKKEARFVLSPADAEHIVQEFDVSGDGTLSQAEFFDMVHSLEREAGAATGGGALPAELWGGAGAGGGGGTAVAAPPHLVLHFDVNNTVLVSDTLTGAGAEDLISMTLAGCAWGVKTQRFDGEDVWVLVCPEPVATQPWQGLVSYTEYVVGAHPFPAPGNSDEVEAVKRRRRAALRCFCAPGEPGEALRSHLDRLLGALRKECRLLPSFLYLLSELKRAGRSFSVVFRTFGVDVDAHIEQEFNAFCEGRHPIFQGGVVLDGSDGQADHRMNLSDTSSIGTFVRGPGDDAEPSLVWGTHRQPPKGQGLEFYRDVAGARVVSGVVESARALHERIAAHSGTVVLRDFYPGWSKAKFASRGGKPLFLRVEDEGLLPVFFDDHIRPVDPNIVDAIDVRDFPRRVPMAQVYDIHLVRAAPLLSIAELSYFHDELTRCERAKAAQLARRRKVASMLHDAGALRGVLRLLHGGGEQLTLSLTPARSPSLSRAGSKEPPTIHYTPWSEMEPVKHATPFVGISSP